MKEVIYFIYYVFIIIVHFKSLFYKFIIFRLFRIKWENFFSLLEYINKASLLFLNNFYLIYYLGTFKF